MSNFRLGISAVSGWFMASGRARRCVRLAGFALLPAGVVGATDVLVDPMMSMAHWQLGGHRVNYVLGSSSLVPVSGEKPPDAAGALGLTYDFAEERRSYLSAYWNGPPIPGECHSVSFWVSGDACARRLRVSIEDAAGRWHQKHLDVIDWEGWRQVSVELGGGDGWRALLRRGEEPQPWRFPVRLRQISVLRNPDAAPRGRILLGELRADTDVHPADFVEADISTRVRGNLFTVGGTAPLVVALKNSGLDAVAGQLNVSVRDFFGTERLVGVAEVNVPVGGMDQVPFKVTATGPGLLEVVARLATSGHARQWHGRVAFSDEPAVDRGEASQFGACGSVRGFRPGDVASAFLRNRDAGLRWGRFTFPWRSLEPAPGQFAWLPPKTTTDAVRGRALDCVGGAGGPTTLPSPLLGLRDELTLAFWIRGSGENGNWQWPVSRATTTTGRSYGFYIGKTTGILTFSGAFEAFPDRGHMDFPTGLNVWDDTWHHVVAVYSAATGQLQITIDGAASGGYAVNGGRLRDCGEPVSFGHVFPGKLDEVLLYSRCLTAEEAAGLSRREPPEMKGLVGWWPFDDANDPGRDRGPNGLDATTRTPTFDTVKRAREHGLRVLGILGFPPAWASSAPEDAVRPWVYKPDLQAWSHHVEEVTRHFKGTVDHWEIWNEPNISVFWEPDPDPREFIDVVRTGYAAAKRGNPECTVITPGLAGPGHNRHGMAFIEELLDLGAARHCDAISIHPYRQDTPEESDLVGDLKHIVAKAEANGGRRTLWATEWCWTTQIGGGSTERRSARMLARGVSLALGTGLMDRIIWFRLHDPGTDRFYSEHNYGLCHNDLTPKPAYFALRTCARLLDGATPVPGGERSGPGVWSRVFERDGRHAMALWRTEGESVVSVSSNEPGLNVTDIMGNCRRVPVEGGIAFVSTSEDAVFVEGVAAAGPVELVVATCPEAVRPGELVELLLKTRNPGKTERNAAVSVSIPSFGFDWSADLPMPPAGDQERRVPLRVPMNALPGVTSVAVVVRLGGHRWQENPTLRVTNIDRGSGPVGVWRFDEGEGEVAHDASGHGNHGVISGCRWVAGRHGTALAFAGGGSRDVGGGDGGDPSVDDVVSVPDTADLDLLEEATLAFWLKLTGDTGTWQFPVTKFLSNQSRNYGVYIRSSDFHVAMSTSLEGASYPHSDVAGRVAVNDGNWHHIAAVFDTTAGEMRLYIDGEEDGRRRADEGLLKTNDEPLRIGAGTHGVIDDVTLYARALPSGEIRSILSGNVGKLVP